MTHTSFTEYLYKVHAIVDSLKNWDLSSKLEEAEATYSTMLQYVDKGVIDPNFKELMERLWNNAIDLEIKALRIRRLQQKPNNSYCVAARHNRVDTQLLAFLNRFREAEIDDKDICTLFNSVWSGELWHNSQTEEMLRFVTDDAVPPRVKAVLISAVTLSLTEMFDHNKLTFLFNAYLTEDIEVSQRSLIGIIIAIRQHDGLIAYYPEITNWMENMAADELFVQQFYNVLMQLQISALTEQTSSRIREDIMPQIKFASNKTRKEMGFVELRQEFTVNGENPEWIEPSDSKEKTESKEKADSKMNTDEGEKVDDKAAEETEKRVCEKMREMAEMQLDGEDIYIANFCYLKKFPFFNQMPHWFYPFTLEEPCIQNTLTRINGFNEHLRTVLFKGSPFCSSDKFSFIFVSEMIGKETFNDVKEQLEGSMENIEEEHKDAQIEAAKRRNRQAKFISRTYIFDLYRFYNIHPDRSEFVSPFAGADKRAFSPLYTHAFAPMLQHTDKLLELADFLVRKKMYADVLAIYNLNSLSRENEDYKFWQKKGFCLQRMEEYAKAKECFIKADNLRPNSKWTLTHLARTAVKTRDYREAMDCYQQLLGIEEENTSYMFYYAECCMKMHKYGKALGILYKANYLNPGNSAISQNIVKCLIVKGEKDKALGYASDGIARGVLLCDLGRTTEAIQQFRQVYQQYIKENKPASTLMKSINDFVADIPSLNTDLIVLIHDAAINHAE